MFIAFDGRRLREDAASISGIRRRAALNETEANRLGVIRRHLLRCGREQLSRLNRGPTPRPPIGLPRLPARG
jgi:hypothetical protein